MIDRADSGFYRRTEQLIETHRFPTLALLASLVQAQRLGDAGERWLNVVTIHAQARLKTLDFNELKASNPSCLLLFSA